MDKTKRRIAINVGAGFVPGLNAVIKGGCWRQRDWGGSLSESATGLAES